MARPPNAPTFHICIVDRACTIRVSTFPSRNHPIPRSKSQSESQEPRASDSTEYSDRYRILGQHGHQIQNRHPQRKSSGYHLQGCHCPGTSAPEGPESNSQCLRAMSQCHHLGSIIQPEWEYNPHQYPRVENPNKADNQLTPLNLHHNQLSLLELYTN